MPGNCRWKEKAQEPSIARLNRNKRTRVLKTHACVFRALLLHIYKKHPGYNLPTESFRHGREKTSGRAFRILSFLSSLSQRIKTDPTKLCTTFSKHGALYPRTVGMPEGKTHNLRIVSLFLPFFWALVQTERFRIRRIESVLFCQQIASTKTLTPTDVSAPSTRAAAVNRKTPTVLRSAKVLLFNTIASYR